MNKVNDEIRVKEMRVITEKGENLGVLSRDEALKAADDHNMDLVLVDEKGNPPTARMMDYSKFKFEQQKRMKEMKKNQTKVEVKEVQLSPTIAKGDFDTKLKNARKFIEKGDKVKITLRLYGRLIGRQELGQKVVGDFIEALSDIASCESATKLEGKTLIAVCAPISKKK